jgi:hypothetical protein
MGRNGLGINKIDLRGYYGRNKEGYFIGSA